MNIIEKKISVLVVLGLTAVFSFALVSTAEAAALTAASTTMVSSYGGRLDSYDVSFAIATQNDDIGRIHLIFPSDFGLPGALGASLATSSIATTTIEVATATVTADGITLWMATSSTHAAGTTFQFINLDQFRNPYVGGSFTLGIETRNELNAVVDNASTTAFTIINAPDVVPTLPGTKTVTPPSSKITSPSVGASIPGGQNYTIKGTALDQGLYAVSKVEVSVDGGSTWATASLTKVSASNFTWEYTWTSPSAGSYTIKSRATDTAGNVESPGTGVSATVSAAAAVTPTTPVSQMTASELQSTIAQLQQQLISLLNQLLQLLTQQLQGY